MFLLPDDYWEVRLTKKKGRGLFAKKDLTEGVVIGDYLGKILRISEEDSIDESENFYLMYYHDQASIYPDLTKPGIHLFNHSCAPNCWMYTYKGHTLFFTLRRIFKNEELTINYLLSPQDAYCNPCTHLCQCGSVMCNQTMHLSKKRYTAWSSYHDKESERTKKQRITYGRNLQRLSSYPKSIPDNPIYTLFGATQIIPVRLLNRTLPPLHTIRKLIRNTGKRLEFPNLPIRVLGVSEKIIFSESLV